MKGGWKIRGNIIYVYGSIDGKHYRLSTGKEATKLNISWIKHNHREVLLKLIEQDKPKVNTNLVEYGRSILLADEYARKKNTVDTYHYVFEKRIAPYFENHSLLDIKPSTLKAWQAKLISEGLSTKTIKIARTIMKSIFNNACADEIIVSSPFGIVKPPKSFVEEKEIVPFSKDEVTIILQNAGDLLNFLTVAFFTGMRTGEILGLMWDDIDFVLHRIHVRRSIGRGVVGTTKTGKNRLIDMLPIVEQTLKALKEDKGCTLGYIFLNNRGKHYNNSLTIVNSRWKPILKKCGFPHRRLYDTRHTFATMMLQNGEDLIWVSQMLGHSNIATTMKYYIKYIPNKSIKRASFSDDILHTNCTDAKKSEV